jgi:RHS repeat-associated protein
MPALVIRHRLRSICAQALLSLGLILGLPASITAQVATGTYLYGTFDNQGFDTINVGNLNAHFAIPVLNKAGRGMPFYYNLSYDSSVWYQTIVSGKLTWTPVQNFGWRGDTEIATGYLSVNINFDSTIRGGYTCFTTTYQSFVYHDPFGIQHTFVGSTVLYTGPSQCDLPTSHGTFSATATDGSGYTLNVTNYDVGTLTSSLGKQFTPPLNVGAGTAATIDSNGNEISVDGSGHFTDTTGKVALTVAGSAPSPHTFTYTDTNGNPQTVSMTYKTYTVQTAFDCSGVGEYGPTSTSLVNTIAFPDGSAYTFSYEPTPGASGNVTGRIASVELPQGGSIDYTYGGGRNGIECADGSTAGLTRSLGSNAGSAASTWTYARTTGAGTSQTEVVDGLDNHKVYNFVEASNQPAGTSAVYYETSRSIYQGSASGTPVVARNTCYDAAAFPCTTASFTLPITQIDTYETLDGIETHGTTAKFNTYGAQTEADIYDYGASARGSLLRKEVWTYGYSIPNLPTQDEVFDGSGNEAGNIVFGYDGSAPTASSGVPQHVAVTGARGNLTSETIYARALTTYAMSATYEDTGSILTSVTPSGTTTLSYDPTFVYNTGSTLPTPSSGVVLGSGQSYDTTNTGLPLISTDPNGQLTTVHSYDSLLRPLEVDSPDGGKTTWTYWNPNQVGQYIYQNAGGVYADTEVQYDSYGRQSRVAVLNGQSGNDWYQVDGCYDANGNIDFRSYAYQSTGFVASKVCTGSGDIYAYDVLGRLKTVTRADGETRSYSYLGHATKFTDENSVTRISQIDGLGRNTIVCEISSNSSLPSSGSPVNCGTDIAGSGFTTTYAYTLATGTTTVTQGAQTRIFQTDWLGRTTSVQEPESGTTTYSYAYNSTGLLITRQKPKANQARKTTLTTTTTQYDSIGRAISVSYTDGTPSKYYYYDHNPNTSWASETTTNLKGRLSIASTSNSSTLLTSSLFSYDPMGRVTTMWQCAPSICGTANQAARPALTFSYDWAGNLTSEFDGASGSIAYGRSPAGEVTSITNQSYQNTQNPANLVSSVVNGPNGPISYSLGNGLSQFYAYDSLGRRYGGWVCSGTPSFACSEQAYGFDVTPISGSQIKLASDNITGQGTRYSYDEFNRLKSMISGNGQQGFTYTYDRYGNRWSQTLTAGSGPQPSFSFNTSNNQITTSGYAYDAAGNMTNDGVHSYTYDAEGNIVTVDTGSTAQYGYDALNHRVRSQTASAIVEYLFDYAGRRTSTWLLNQAGFPAGFGEEGRIYWDGQQIAFRSVDGSTYFDHQDWLGTERARTNYQGATAATYFSLPWGDAYTPSITDANGDQDSLHFGELDQDAETSTEHAQFRQYNNAQGHWMSPDPYSGSYNGGNPQSMNRYSYVLNNPLRFVDPLGLTITCDWSADTDNADGSAGVTSGVETCEDDGGGGGGGDGGGGDPGGPTGGGGGAAPNKSTCTISNGRTTGIAPSQAPGPGAFGFVPQAGSVAIDPWALGLPPGGSTNALLGPNASQITFSFSPGPNLPQGYPTTITLGSIVGPKSVRTGGANFNGFFDFDFYGLPSFAAAYAVTSQPVTVTVTYPSSLPISCNGPALDSPIQGPLPSPPGPVSAVRRRLQ